MSGYRILYQGGTDEIVEKKSRFIANTYPVETEEEALAYITACKKKYYDARHNCYAYTIGKNMELKRFSDDGEPGGTAGKPILDVLEREEIHNALIVVTRYFGGTLLGTGGLVRAYQGAAQAGMEASHILEKQMGFSYEIGTDYNNVGRLQYILAEQNITTLDTEYSDKVVFKILLPKEQEQQVITKIVEETSATAKIEKLAEVEYGIVGQKTILF